jgi:N-acyl-D-aspartate/D-glutamate deacylase
VFDVVIRGGTVVDGTGRPARRADVALDGDRVRVVGAVTDRGRVEIAADDRIVAPGFVDAHTHLDAQLWWDGLATPLCWHGVTTAVMGNCGFTLAPCAADAADLALRSLERAEDIPREAMLAGIDWTWESLPEHLDALDRLPKGLNVAMYAGHSTLRTHVMGARAYEGAASEDDRRALERILAEALDAGVVGFSTSRSVNHLTADDRPVASRMADWDEVRALTDVMRRHGRGLVQMANEQYDDPAETAAFHARVGALTLGTGRPVTVLSSGAPGLLPLYETWAARGGRAFGQVCAREFQSVIGFPVRLPYDHLPSWQPVRRRPLAEQRAALADPTLRQVLADEAAAGAFRGAIGAEARPPDYGRLEVLDAGDGPRRTVDAVAEERGVHPAQALVDLSVEAGLDLLFAQPMSAYGPERILRGMRHPQTVVAGSDSGAHLSQLIDSSIPTHVLAHWVREEGVLTIEEAVRMLSAEPAERWGLEGRGVLREGAVADVVVFDAATVRPALPTAARDLPTGAVRLLQRAVGIDATLVAGQVVWRDGVHTGARPGRLLRGGVL